MKHTALKTICICLASTYGGQAMANTACEGTGPLTIISATDDGLYEETHGPENTIDGNLDPGSRWSNESQGTAKSLLLDLGAEQTLKGLNIAWYKGNSRKSNYMVEVSADGTDYQTVIPQGQSAGETADFEVTELPPVQAQFVRIVSNGNESNEWNSIVEVAATGCGTAVEKPDQPVLTERRGNGLFGLRADQTPGQNFDLLGWYVTTPADDDGDGKSDSVYENDLAAGWTDKRFFYTDPATGGMVFRSTPAGAKTSANTSYTRTELRGMLRRGDGTIQTRTANDMPNKNNWVFSSAPASAQAMAGGVDGVMKATLAVNQVTRQGKDYQIGRVIIGQIHAKDDEPIRLYYRKLPKNKYGSIFYAHEPATGKEQWIEVIGSRSNTAANPDDGIALDEVFSYEIAVKGEPEGDQIIPMLHVKIIRDDGTEVVAEPLDMRDSGFSVENEFMFFKAGAYSQNNTSPEPETDFDRVIFYALEATHDPAPEATGEAATQAPEPVLTTPALPGVVFDDSFADGGREDGADAMDSNWWTTSSSAALEIAPNTLGLVTGGSGRGIRTTFTPQTLAEGQTLQASFTFTTPETIGTDRDSALRIGLYDKLGRAELEGDLSASSKSPNAAYDGLPGYMIDFDIGLADASAANIDIRAHKNDTQGRLLGTTKGYTRLGGGGDPYTFEAGKTYTGTMSLKPVANGVEITGSLGSEGEVLSTFTHLDEGSEVNNIGMLAFHVNSKTFGSSKKADTPDNGIDFSRVTVEVLP
ncbi:polysaccharide lyase family 7 protein [Alphaproteobacteria bacterium KMM 3653]|uniref:Polysaccharide lyase family 7 protein n=1 Tax=Harenicola maris TaxID=2841044 RepID=A0AAP2G5V5_9RHOB|nr:polysaccharide lyase family 7 protein [Harenicola maris]